MAGQLEKLEAIAFSVQDLAAPCDLDLLLVNAEALAHIITNECLERQKAVSEGIDRPSSALFV